MKFRLIADWLTEQILDTSVEGAFIVDVETDDLDLVEDIVGNWSPGALVSVALQNGWRVTEV